MDPMTVQQVGDLLARRGLLILLDRAGGEVTITTEDFDAVTGLAVTIKAIAEPPHFILTLVTEARAHELMTSGVPIA